LTETLIYLIIYLCFVYAFLTLAPWRSSKEDRNKLES